MNTQPQMRRTTALASGLFAPALDLLVAYAKVHRDRRNIQTHVVGVPVGILAVAVFLRGPHGSFSAGPVSPAWALFGLICTWYLTRGNLRLGLAASAAVGSLVYAAHQLPAAGIAPWLIWSLGLLVFAGLLQAMGHYYEGRRPASWESPVYVLVGPLFLTAHLLSGIGFLRALASDMERRAGPVHVRDLAHPLPQR